MKEFKSWASGKTDKGRLLEFTSVRDEKVKVLVNSCIRRMDRIGNRNRNKKPCAARLQEGWSHAVSKLRRAVSMKIVVEKRCRSNIALVT